MAEEDINIFEQATEYIPTKDELKNFAAKSGAAAIDFPIAVANIPLATFTAAESAFSNGDFSDVKTIPMLTPFIDDLTQSEANMASDIGAAVVGGGATFVAQMKALNKIEKSAPSLYKQLSKAFPYFVEHAHQYYKKVANPTSKTLGGKALDFITTSIKEAAGNPTVWKKSAANLLKIGKYGSFLGALTGILAPTKLGDGTLKPLGVDKIVDWTENTDHLSEDQVAYLETLNPYLDENNQEVDLSEMILTADEADKLTKERELRDKNYGWAEWLKEYTGIELRDDPSERQPEITKFNEGPPENKYVRPAAGFAGEETQRKPKISIDFGDPNMDDVTEGILTKEGNFADNLAYGGQPDGEGMFSDSINMTGMEGDDVDVKEIINQPGFMGTDELDIFDEAKKQGYEEVQTANLFGKVPLWAVANVPKWKMLKQIFTKNEKKNMDNVKNKVGTKEEVEAEIEDIDIIDTPAGGTEVGAIKSKKTIIDSPENAESAFYSGLEARLMDSNTPISFSSKKELFDFLNQKGISKAEIDDNLLTRYIEVAEKNNVPIATKNMLEILRKAPMRKIDTVTYGDARYGGTKSSKYGGGHYESGEIPGSYREQVLYLDPEYIPMDPGTLPRSGHDFTEKFVIGWTRKTDRNATLPVDKTAQGIAEQVDPAMIRTLKRNQKTLDRQLKGLETSAMRKLEREGLIEVDDIDNLTMAEIRNILDIDTMARLRSIDEPLEQQILQFRMKLDEDALKLQKMEATTKGAKVIITMADEIQSDILQQAKRFEEDLRKQLGDLMDLSATERLKKIQTSGYGSSYRNVDPEVAEFYVKNKTVFRPLFQNESEMQIFIDKFNDNKKVFEQLADAGPRPDKQLIQKAREAEDIEQKMLIELQTTISENAMKQLHPNLPFKNRTEWGEALIKMDLANAANLLYGPNKIPDAAQWYAVSPAKFITKRYGQTGGTSTPRDQRTKDMKGIGMEEFYGGPDSVDPSGKHYTSVIEKALKRAAQENNSEFKIIKVDGMGDVFAIKITPEMLLPHKTHRKKGGMVYTPEIIDIFEAA
jgi:hypothetical protein